MTDALIAVGQKNIDSVPLRRTMTCYQRFIYLIVVFSLFSIQNILRLSGFFIPICGLKGRPITHADFWPTLEYYGLRYC